MTKTRINLRLDTREWNWELAGNLTPGAVKDLVEPVKAANPHTASFLTVTRTPRWVDVATNVADWWLGWNGLVRFAAYFVAGAMLGVGVWLHFQ